MNDLASKWIALLAAFSVVACTLIAPSIGSSRVSAATYTVTNLSDSGAGSLRQAIIDANANTGADTINFQAGLTGTITLTTGQLDIRDSLTINGPGLNILSVSGNNASRVFEIFSGVVMISGLTITHGSSVGLDHGDFGGGGGVYNSSTLTIPNSTLSNNSASGNSGGGGIFNLGTLTVTNSTLSDNVAPNGSGGGIITMSSSDVTVINSTLSGNSAGSTGGAIENVGTLKISDSILSSNTSNIGGGISGSAGKVTVTNSTLSGNSASSGNGGAIFNTAMLAVHNSTVSNNSASGSGGGLHNIAAFDVPPIANISNCTFSGNSAQIGGGINTSVNSASTPATVNIKNSIVANSTSGGDCGGNGTFNASGVNFSTDSSCPGFTHVTPSQLNLGPLGNNGGPTKTHALLAGSMAIDAVSDCTDLSNPPQLVNTDQREVMRPIDGDGNGSVRCDAGSYEAPECTSGDTSPPQINCPSNVIAIAVTQYCRPSNSTVVSFSPTATDNCSSVDVMCSPASGSLFPIGTTTVTCTATDASSNTTTCGFTVTVFNGRLQDDSNQNNTVLFNTVTGEYRFCCNGTIFKGTAMVSTRGCTFALQHNPPDRRLGINVDFATMKGSASLQSPPGVSKCTITDRDISNDTSSCP